MGRMQERARSALRAAGLPEDAALGATRVTMVGGGVARIENHRGLVEMTDERIRLRTTEGMLTIAGKHLSLRLFTAESVEIEGEISAMTR